jgi:hypothetical protein
MSDGDMISSEGSCKQGRTLDEAIGEEAVLTVKSSKFEAACRVFLR